MKCIDIEKYSHDQECQKKKKRILKIKIISRQSTFHRRNKISTNSEQIFIKDIQDRISQIFNDLVISKRILTGDRGEKEDKKKTNA